MVGTWVVGFNDNGWFLVAAQEGLPPFQSRPGAEPPNSHYF